MPEHTPVPTPHRAVYGFAFFTFFKILFIVYLFWAFVPDHMIENSLGLTYLPDKYFALCVPMLVCCALTVFGFFIYPSWNLSMQHDIDAVHTIHDRYSLVRCKYIMQRDNGRNDHPNFIKYCDRKVDPVEYSGRENNWWLESYCDFHRIQATEWAVVRTAAAAAPSQNHQSIYCFCDCTDRSKCILRQIPRYIDELLTHEMTPNICDIDIVQTCQELFRH